MNKEKFDAVFVIGMVRNNTTGNMLRADILSSYLNYCEWLVAQAESLPAHLLYDRSARFLENLLNKERRDINKPPEL